ncbi:MAG: PIN domain-containing protein [Verrucomicrobia bacterium]|nr:PIN domain-containing protein [Verrucomicrobiota bacterium]
MRVCFDTSTLVAALLQKHPHHRLALVPFEAVHQGTVEGCLTSHAIAELFATLTALPLKPKLTVGDAQHLLGTSILPHFQVIELNARAYQEALSLTTMRKLAGGAIYDALHLVGARASQCEKLYTFNLRHFQALAPNDPMIVSPG